MSNRTIEIIVAEHLGSEIQSGDLRRIRHANLAEEANERYGTGNWFLSSDLGFHPLDLILGPKAIPLSQPKK